MDSLQKLRIKVIFTALLSLTMLRGQSAELPGNCLQILRVTTASPEASSGTLQRLERRKNGQWKAVGAPIPVSVGRNGLAPDKQEGDGKAPAGIFALGTAYGYSKTPPKNCRIPYRQATANDFFVDDSTSAEYNQWVHLAGGYTAAKARWKSFEKMKRNDELYELGIVVNYNMNPTVPGAGSAIFIHLWRGPGMPTSGCTAMSRENLLKLLGWLNPKANPMLVQGPIEIRY